MTNPTAIITGGALRLGKAIALELHNQGCNIVVHCNQSVNAAFKLAEQLNQLRSRSCHVFCGNLNNAETSQQLIEYVIKQFSHIDILINNASVFYPTLFTAQNGNGYFQQLIQNLTVNFKAPCQLATIALPFLKKRQGSIVNMIDIYAEAGLKDHTAYVAAKAALKESTKQMAEQMAPKVRVNSVSPGAILWPEKSWPEKPSPEKSCPEKSRPENAPQDPAVCQKQQAILDNTALKHLGSPEHIAKTVAFLALKASYITGENINVDGGRRLYI